MSRWEVKQQEEIKKEMEILTKQFGFESEPVLYFAKLVQRFPSNHKIYFRTASNWKFNWDE